MRGTVLVALRVASLQAQARALLVETSLSAHALDDLVARLTRHQLALGAVDPSVCFVASSTSTEDQEPGSDRRCEFEAPRLRGRDCASMRTTGELLELVHVMRTEYLYIGRALASQRAKPPLIAQAPPTILFHEDLVGAEPRRAGGSCPLSTWAKYASAA